MSRFKEYAEYRNAANKDILKLFPMMLNKRAYEWYQSQSEDIKRDWNALESAFNEKYGPTSKSFVEQTLLLDKTQGTSESVREYAAEMAKRFALAGTSEVESRKIFMTGLKTELKPYVISKTPTSWSEAEKVAIEAEQIYTMQEDAIKATCAKMIKKENSEDRTTAAAIRQLEERMEFFLLLQITITQIQNGIEDRKKRYSKKKETTEGEVNSENVTRITDDNGDNKICQDHLPVQQKADQNVRFANALGTTQVRVKHISFATSVESKDICHSNVEETRCKVNNGVNSTDSLG